MSSIESSNQSLNNILDKIGVRTPEGVPTKRKKQSWARRLSKINDYSASKIRTLLHQWKMANLLLKWHSFQR